MRPALSHVTMQRMGLVNVDEDDLPDTLRLVPGLDEPPPTVPCPQFAQQLAIAANNLSDDANLVEALWDRSLR